MELTAENYYSPEANAEYMSVSQFKSFAGTDGKLACEAEAMAELRGEWEMKKTRKSAWNLMSSSRKRLKRLRH